MTLDEAIQSFINLGEKDPLSIAQKLEERYPEELPGWLAAYAQDFVAELARKRLGAERRAEIVKLQPGRVVKREVILKSKWVPGVGWVRLADLTRDDIRAIVTNYTTLARALDQYSDWFQSVLVEMERQDVETLGELKGALPTFPEQREAIGA